MIFILVLLFAINYTMYGYVEGLVWSKEGDEAFSWNEHGPLVVQRVCLGLLALGCGWLEWEVTWKALVASLPMFFFFHNGMIYLTRNAISTDIYDKRWFDESTTTSASLGSMSATWRVIFFGVGVLLAAYFQFLS